MFEFDLQDEVIITVSGESGKVIGRAEFSSSGRQCLVRYCGAEGRGVEQWWDECALHAPNDINDEEV